VRELMAELGFRTMDEMIGRVDRLDMKPALAHWKASGVDLSNVLHAPQGAQDAPRRCVRSQDHRLEEALDVELIARASAALERQEPIEIASPIGNVNRAVGTRLGYEVTRRYGGEGLPDDTIRIRFTGSAGQSFGAFLPRGITLTLEGDSNDYWGKGLSGGRLIVFPPRQSTFAASENIIIGNVSLYGGTGGEAYVSGIAGERFAVRNSGVKAVVEGVGDHGCEYMTAGLVVVIGRTGRNFAAGMSGGIAYVLDADDMFEPRCNRELVDLRTLEQDDEEQVRELLERHAQYTGSAVAGRLLSSWTSARAQFVKVLPRDYARMLAKQAPAPFVRAEPESTDRLSGQAVMLKVANG
jgi:glutamate synthase domain-containing protein 3